LLTDLKKNLFYEFGTLLHCFNDRSLNFHIVRTQNVLLWPVRRRKDVRTLRYQLRSVEGHAKCPVLFLNVVNSWLAHALLDKAVN